MATMTATAQTISMDPVSRIEGHLRVNVTVDAVNGQQQVVDAKVGGTLFRGFEKILINRNPLDAPDLSERICGVCPVSQGLAATLALEATNRTVVPTNARVMRNLILAADHIHSALLHFYVLSLVNYVDGPPIPPWTPTWGGTPMYITGTAATALIDNYVQALTYRRMAHEMGAQFAGRLPHPPSLVPGGFTTTPRAGRISQFLTYLKDVAAFVQGPYLDDVHTVAGAYPEYSSLGAGPRNMLAYGVYDLDSTGTYKLLKRGFAPDASASALPLDPAKVTESVTSSWYDNGGGDRNPSRGVTNPVDPRGKASAYSWLKAPRYNGLPCEVGPLARMWVNGDYRNGVSVMDRHLARAHEAVKIVGALTSWVNELQPASSVYQRFTVPSSGTGIGLTEAPRGALGHWVRVSKGSIANYQIVSPTCWNASPRDNKGVPGPIEQALLGLPVADPQNPVEVARVIHSFDPCLGCAVHVMRPGDKGRVFKLNLRG